MRFIQKHRTVAILLFIILITILNLGVGVLFAQSNQTSGPIVAFGDSLVAGVGSTAGNDFVSILSRNINRPIINAGVGGDTTASALARVSSITALHPALVLVFLGGNDILQDVPQSQTISNLFSIIIALEQSGAQVILIGIDNSLIPSSYATQYANLANQTGVTYIPGVLNGVIGNGQLTVDAVHPNNAGYAIIANRILPTLQSQIANNPAIGSSSPNQSSTTDNIQQPNLIGWCAVNASINPAGDYGVLWNSIVLNSIATNTSYTWSGTDGLSGTGQSIQKSYKTPGLKQGNATIKSDPQTINFNCSADFHNSAPANSNYSLSATCSPSINGMTVHWETISGASIVNNATTTYKWTGTDGLATTSRSFDFTYTTEGTKTATVMIDAGIQSMILSCQARIASTTGTGHCFIATAAYGTPLEPEVMVLRHFRDETLMQTNTGKLAVKAYYAVSPPIADFIRNNETLRAVVRAGLEPIVYGLKAAGYTE